MIRLPHALALTFLFVSCAQSNAFIPTVDGGSGGSGGGTTAVVGSGGSAGVPEAGPEFLIDGGPCEPFAATFTPACFACLATSCCDPATACVGVPDCFGFASCQQNCPAGAVDAGTDPCLVACAHGYPMADPTFGALTACLHTSCAGTCPY